MDEKQASRSGIAGYVMKPVSLAHMASVIRKVLDKPH